MTGMSIIAVAPKLVLVASLLCAGGCITEECPDPSLITDEIKNATGGEAGTARIHGEVTALETCDDNYCRPGRVVAMVKIDDVEADCSKVRESSRLDEGQEVPVSLPENAPAVAVGTEMDIGCVVLQA